VLNDSGALSHIDFSALSGFLLSDSINCPDAVDLISLSMVQFINKARRISIGTQRGNKCTLQKKFLIALVKMTIAFSIYEIACVLLLPWVVCMMTIDMIVQHFQI
jgi:hypothetical protein